MVLLKSGIHEYDKNIKTYSKNVLLKLKKKIHFLSSLDITFIKRHILHKSLLKQNNSQPSKNLRKFNSLKS